MAATHRSPDFDALVRLHRSDPEAFEETRRAMLREAVEAAPSEHRPALEQLLVRIEAVRADAESPVHAACDAFQMMCESVERLHGAWDGARYAAADLQAAILIEQARLRH